MNGPDLVVQIMQSLKTKAEAYRETFPVGSVIDPQSPVYLDMLQSLKAANGTIKQWETEQLDQAKELLAILTKQEKAANALVTKLEAQEATQQNELAARVKAALEPSEDPSLRTLPFEEAYSPKAARLQHLITRFSQIGHSTVTAPPAQ